MSEPRVIQADYTSWRPVAGRKVLQIILEVPIEQTADVMDKLGVPMPGESKWCAVALLDLKPKAEGQESAANGSTKKSWGEYKPSQQAAILCADPAFMWYFIGPIGGEDDCIEAIRTHFKIKSRKELDQPENHARWDEFVALYNLHRDRLK